MSWKAATMMSGLMLVGVGCGPSAEEKAQAERKAKEEAFRQMVEEAASQKLRLVPIDGGPATRPLVPEGFGKTEGAAPPPWRAQEQPKPQEPAKAENPSPQ
jgi:hypothetical protein